MLSGFGAYALGSVVETAPSIIDTRAGAACTVVARLLLLASIMAVVLDRSARGMSFWVARAGLIDSRTGATRPCSRVLLGRERSGGDRGPGAHRPGRCKV